MQTAISEVVRTLGIVDRDRRLTSPINLIALIEGGLPVSALERVSKLIAPSDASFKYRIVSRATLARRRKPGQERLQTDESDRLVRLARIWSFATDVWGGEDAARAFFFRPHPLLENRLPVDVVLASELGAELVNDILGRLKYGSAA